MIKTLVNVRLPCFRYAVVKLPVEVQPAAFDYPCSYLEIHRPATAASYVRTLYTYTLYSVTVQSVVVESCTGNSAQITDERQATY